MKRKWMFVVAMAGMLALTGACGKSKEAAGETVGAETAAGGKLVKLAEYKGIEVTAVDATVTDEELQEMIDSLLAEYPNTVEVEGKTTVEDGDIVNIDYVGTLNGEAFDGGSSDEGGYDLEIGSGSFIEGFEEGLIGKKVGGTYNLELTFPEDYYSEDLAGQDVVFEVTVNKIVEYVEAEWNDEFVQKNTWYDSVDAYVEGTKADWAAYKEEQATAEKMEEALNAIIAESEFEYEDSLDATVQALKEEYQSEAEMYELDLETYMYYMYGYEGEDLDAQLKEEAEYQLKVELVINAIAEKEKLTLTEEEYTEGLQTMADEYWAESPEAFEEEYGREMVEEALLYDKVAAFILENAVEK